MAFPLRVDGKVAFITGSSRGIGWATAKMLAEAGASVVLHGHSSPEILRQRAEETHAEVEVGDACIHVAYLQQ